MKARSFIAAFFCALILLSAAPGQADQAFDIWLEGVAAEARTKGVSQATIDAAFKDLQPIKRIVELDRSQPEFTQTLWTYLDKRVSDEMVAEGKQRLKTHRALLERIQRTYGVQPRFLVAFWGLETRYGRYFGSFSAIAAVATLAYDARRSKFFRSQLLALLILMEKGHIRPDAKSSWAGAMGHFQFIPTTFRAHAQNFDDSADIDIWHSLPDALASAANFLAKMGWDGSKTWGREVILPASFDLSLSGRNIRKSLAQWNQLGVRRADTRGPLPEVDIDASVILPMGLSGPAFLVYDNFKRIMGWNQSEIYAISVGHLADRLVGRGKLVAPKPLTPKAISHDDIKRLQRRLDHLGFDPGPPDGLLGPKTRDAIKAFQRKENIPPDGYPGPEILRRLL